eukprot:19519-Heterococcus_DN1.PRE.2
MAPNHCRVASWLPAAADMQRSVRHSDHWAPAAALAQSRTSLLPHAAAPLLRPYRISTHTAREAVSLQPRQS